MVQAWLEAEREQWFLWVPVAFGSGIALYFWLPEEPRLASALLGVAAAVVLFAVVRDRVVPAIAAGFLLAATLGFAAAKLRTEWVRAPVLERRTGAVLVTGFVELIEPRPAHGERLSVAVTAMDGFASDRMPRHIRVRSASKLAAFKPGDGIRFKAVLMPPQGPYLPGGYDFARAAWFQSLGGVGYTLSRPEPVSLGAAPWPLDAEVAIERMRKRIGARIRAALPGETGAIADALITGARGGITDATNGAYKASGLYHILSISGLHMVVVAGSMFWVSRLLFAAFPVVALAFPIKKWAAVIAALATVFYLLMSGSAFATVRSAIMISILFIAILLDRPAIALRNVALAALVILALWPESLLDAGFQMSFAATAALISAFEAISRRDQRRSGTDRPRRGPVTRTALFFGGTVLSTVVATLAVAPFSIYHFHQTQQLGLLSNAIAVPICDLVVMPAALVTLALMPFGLEGLPLWVMGKGIDAMTACATFVESLPGAVQHIPGPPPLAFALLVAGGLWLLLWKTGLRLAGGALIAAGILTAMAPRKPDVLIGADGLLVAVRGSDGRLAALPAPQAKFVLGRWLEHDGDDRTADKAISASAFRCDTLGCVAAVADTVVAVAKHPAALRDDCVHATVLIVRMPKPRDCPAPKAVIDIFALKSLGAHALFIDAPDNIRIATVRHAGESRPWAELPQWARRPKPEARTVLNSGE